MIQTTTAERNIGLHVTVCLLVCLTLACSRRVAADGESAEQDYVASSAAAQVALNLQDLSVLLAPVLEHHSLELYSTIAQSGDYYALAAKGLTAEYIVLARNTEDTIELIGELIEIPKVINRYPEVEWFSVGAEPNDYLRFTKDDVVQGETATQLFRIEAQELVSVYVDEEASCKPAQIHDLNGDGRVEIVSFVDVPARAVCSSICEMEIRERFGIAASWIRVWRWVAGSWIVAEEKFPEYYLDQAERYDRIVAWLGSEAGQSACGTVDWLAEGRVFEVWASRARLIANGEG